MKTIIANWKMNPQTLEEARDLFGAETDAARLYSSVSTVICPPFVFLEELAKIDKNHLGAQDIFLKEAGPYIYPTESGGRAGKIPAEMLKNLGVSHVLVGHSDRRYKIGETDEIINKKIKAALAAGMVPVLLVGEKERGNDRQQVLEEQLSADLADLSAEQLSRLLVTYEPVWAISTNANAEADTPEKALEAIGMIKQFLSDKFALNQTAMLYGGSVNEKNVADFLKHNDIAGAVVGGASLRKEEFANILSVASKIGLGK